MSNSIKRYVIVGTSGRSIMFQNAIENTYQEHAELVGLCDTNPGRLNAAQERSRINGAPIPPAYLAKDFDTMIRETRPDTVIVTTVDAFHSDYIVRAMELGCDAMSEKPMTTSADRCQRIIDTQKKTGKKCTVTFNYRYAPPRTQIKDMLMSGAIGDVLSVDFNWWLNTVHGADYFRRWHSDKANSGGLLVHKATHHFDLINWWLSAVPVSVLANGKKEFYIPETAKRLGLDSHHERCHTCPESGKCTFFLDMAGSELLTDLYLNCEHHDGYIRDRCVFRPDIGIEDTMNVLVEYDSGTTLSYSLNAFNAGEGYSIAFNGSKGRIEQVIREQVYVSGTSKVQGGLLEDKSYLTLQEHRQEPRRIDLWTGEGSHGGGDKVLLDDLFLAHSQEDPYKRAADHRSGAYSILTGIAANRSIETGASIQINDLVNGLGYPDYPLMPSKVSSIPMPCQSSANVPATKASE